MMRNLHTILCMGTLLFLFSCKQEHLELYSGNPAIYFQGASRNNSYEPKDNGNFSFGYMDPAEKNAIYSIIVASMGSVQTSDRPYKLSIDPSSDLKEGRDFEFMDRSFTIKSGQVNDTLFLVLNRTAAMKEKNLTVYLQLESNEHFTTAINSQLIGTGANQETKYFTTFTFWANDIAGTPWFWDATQSTTASIINGYLGKFSGKKLKLLIDRYGLNLEEITAIGYQPSVSSILAWAYGLKSYFEEMQAGGTPVLDEDGLPMTLGVYLQ